MKKEKKEDKLIVSIHSIKYNIHRNLLYTLHINYADEYV